MLTVRCQDNLLTNNAITFSNKDTIHLLFSPEKNSVFILFLIFFNSKIINNSDVMKLSIEDLRL